MSYSTDREKLLNGETSCKVIVQNFLDTALKNKNNAFVNVFSEDALSRAELIDQKIKDGKAKSLAGLVFSVKDLISIEEKPISGASKILQGYQSPYHATAVKRLLEEDAILLGTTNCDEFGMGSSNENSHYGPVTNNLDQNRVPGGSSGGAAVSVQEGSCHVALGTDTGGSVRQPAAFCGLYGLKPTYSRISRFGLLAYASSFDTIGIIGSSVDDVEKTLDVIEGFDEKDSTVSSSGKSKNISFSKLAYFKEAIDSDGLQPEIKDHFLQTIESLRANGLQVTEVDFPISDHLLETYYILTTAEASSNLSRYDGLRYGFGDESEKASSLKESYLNTRTEGFGEEVKRRIFLGTFVLSASYYDAYYTKAQKARQLIRQETLDILNDHDLIISPVTPTTAFEIGSHTKDPIEMYLSDLYTVHASVCGLPALSIPAGTDEKDLPFGIQATAGDFEEQKLIEFAKYLSNLGL